MPLTLHLSRSVTPAPPLDGDAVPVRVAEVAAMFGLGVDRTETLELIPPTTLTLRPGQVTFVSGASGSGKSTLLHLIAGALADDPAAALLDFAALPEPADRPLVEALDDGAADLPRVLGWLSMAGLNDAFVMLRRPCELSDGQRYRFSLARCIALAERRRGDALTVVVADEFGATLDRTTAAVLARNVRRWVSRSGVAFVAATTHDDLLEPLEPDVLVEKRLGAGITVLSRGAGNHEYAKTRRHEEEKKK